MIGINMGILAAAAAGVSGDVLSQAVAVFDAADLSGTSWPSTNGSYTLTTTDGTPTATTTEGGSVAVNFDGATCMESTALGAVFAGDQAFTRIIAYEDASSANGAAVVALSDTTGNRWDILQSYGTVPRCTAVRTDGAAPASAPTEGELGGVWVDTWDGEVKRCQSDKVARVADGSSTGGFALSTFSVGGLRRTGGATSDFATAKIYKVAIWDRVLTDSEISEVRAAWQAEMWLAWALTVLQGVSWVTASTATVVESAAALNAWAGTNVTVDEQAGYVEITDSVDASPVQHYANRTYTGMPATSLRAILHVEAQVEDVDCPWCYVKPSSLASDLGYYIGGGVAPNSDDSGNGWYAQASAETEGGVTSITGDFVHGNSANLVFQMGNDKFAASYQGSGDLAIRVRDHAISWHRASAQDHVTTAAEIATQATDDDRPSVVSGIFAGSDALAWAGGSQSIGDDSFAVAISGNVAFSWARYWDPQLYDTGSSTVLWRVSGTTASFVVGVNSSGNYYATRTNNAGASTSHTFGKMPRRPHVIAFTFEAGGNAALFIDGYRSGAINRVFGGTLTTLTTEEWLGTEYSLERARVADDSSAWSIDKVRAVSAKLLSEHATLEPIRASILFGQSNMVGGQPAVELTSRPGLPAPNRMCSLWYRLGDPVTESSGWRDCATRPGNGAFGPEIGLAEALGGRRAFIKYAVSGSGLAARWLKSQADLYPNLVAHISTALSEYGSHLEIDSVIWVGGESDSVTQANADAIGANMQQMLDDLRADLGLPHLRFSFNRLNNAIDPAQWPYRDNVIAAQDALVASDDRFIMATLDGAQYLVDEPGDVLTHYESDGMRTLGQRLGQAMVAAGL